MKRKDINDWTIKDFLKLPHRKWNEKIEDFDSIIIIPMKDIHDSGYRCMDFVACKDDSPICLLSGCSDVIHLDGIVSKIITKSTFSIDCLRKSKLLRIFCSGYKLNTGYSLSSFEIFRIKIKD